MCFVGPLGGTLGFQARACPNGKTVAVYYLEVSNREEFEAWIPHLVHFDVAHSAIKELGHASFTCVNDPDGIPIELWHAMCLVPVH